MEPGESLSCSQEPVSVPYYHLNPHPHTLIKTHLRLDPASGLFPTDCRTKSWYPSPSYTCAISPAHPIVLDLIALIIYIITGMLSSYQLRTFCLPVSPVKAKGLKYAKL